MPIKRNRIQIRTKKPCKPDKQKIVRPTQITQRKRTRIQLRKFGWKLGPKLNQYISAQGTRVYVQLESGVITVRKPEGKQIQRLITQATLKEIKTGTSEGIPEWTVREESVIHNKQIKGKMVRPYNLFRWENLPGNLKTFPLMMDWLFRQGAKAIVVSPEITDRVKTVSPLSERFKEETTADLYRGLVRYYRQLGFRDWATVNRAQAGHGYFFHWLILTREKAGYPALK